MKPEDPQTPRSLSGAGASGGPPVVVLVGAGKMGGAMADGWLMRGLPAENLIIVDPGLSAPPVTGVTLFPTAADMIAALAGTVPDVCILAVKPQMMDAVLPELRPLAAKGVLFLSIAAGTSLSELGTGLGGTGKIIRAMPNTPAAIGWGMTALIGSRTVTPQDRILCAALAGAVGDVAWLDEEAQMDAVTALSGSGPAYVFLLTECMAEAGRRAGLPDTLARTLAQRTVTGAGMLLDRSEDAPDTLRRNVTSPGGTTAAALAVLMDDPGLQDLLDRAIAAAAERSRELSG